MRAFTRSAALWLAVGTAVVLVARWIAYELAPSPLAMALQGRAGGPRLLVVAGVALGLALAAGLAIVGLVALAVRERGLLESRPWPRLRLARLVVRALVLWAATCLGFALLESTIHWSQGLGWHGLHCLVGPVHADAVPVLLALSLVAAAIVAAAEHVLAWLRRTLELLDSPLRLGAPLLPVPPVARVRIVAAARSSRRSRAPPPALCR